MEGGAWNRRACEMSHPERSLAAVAELFMRAAETSGKQTECAKSPQLGALDSSLAGAPGDSGARDRGAAFPSSILSPT